jgi:hypothetical protein
MMLADYSVHGKSRQGTPPLYRPQYGTLVARAAYVAP